MDHDTPLAAEAAPASSEPLPSRRSRAWRAVLSAVLGLAVGLGATEAAFRRRDGGAFPLVNVYERDAQRGVRLAPGSVTVVGRPGERATRVRVNEEGYRGGPWPAPSHGDVLVVGDSLSFGLGVEEDEALPARLRAALPGAPAVIDASVPTYGPPEYLITMDQLLARRQPGTVVLALNLANDLMEVDRPNTGRHAAVDGYAARVSEGAPAPASSPLVEWTIQRSHAAFALWRWERTRQASAMEPEPGVDDLVALAARVAGAVRYEDQQRSAEAQRAAALAGAETELREAKRGVLALVSAQLAVVTYSRLEQEWRTYVRDGGEPEASVFEIGYGGCIPPYDYREGKYVPRPPRKVRYAGDTIRRDVEDYLVEMAPGLGHGKLAEVRAAIERRDAAQARLQGLPTEPLPPPPPRAPLPIAPVIERAAALASSHGARLVVLVAPLDAQASPDARRRRELSDAEVGALDVLSAEVASAARAAGAIGVDATPALKQAGAAAYLPDGHLSAAGHDVVAHALAAALTEG
jgi:lysophospholipase L1-like esterase